MKKITFMVEDETYTMTIAEMAENLTRDFAREILSAEDFKEFVKAQDAFMKAQADAAAEYARTHYIPSDYGYDYY